MPQIVSAFLSFELRVPLFDHAECILCDLDRFFDVLVGDGGVDEVVVVRRQKSNPCSAAAALKPSVSFVPFSRNMVGMSSFFILLMHAMLAANVTALIQYEPV